MVDFLGCIMNIFFPEAVDCRCFVTILEDSKLFCIFSSLWWFFRKK